jgi:hypothetical protein
MLRSLVSKTSLVNKSGADKSRFDPSSPGSNPRGFVLTKNALYCGVETDETTWSHSFCRSTCATVAIYPPKSWPKSPKKLPTKLSTGCGLNLSFKLQFLAIEGEICG